MTRPAPAPKTTTATAVFLLGAALGVVLVGPVVPRLATALPAPASLGTFGVVLVAGAVGLVGFVLGLFLLYLVLRAAES